MKGCLYMSLIVDISKELSTKIFNLVNAIFKKGYEKNLSSIILSFNKQNEALDNFKKYVKEAMDQIKKSPERLPLRYSSYLDSLLEFAEMLTKISLCKNGQLDEKDMYDLDMYLDVAAPAMYNLGIEGSRFIRKIYKFINMFYEDRKESDKRTMAGRKHLEKYLKAVKNLTISLTEILELLYAKKHKEMNFKAYVSKLENALSDMKEANPEPKIIRGSDRNCTDVSDDVSGIWLALETPWGKAGTWEDKGGIYRDNYYAVKRVIDSLKEFTEKFEETFTKGSRQHAVAFREICREVCDALGNAMEYDAPAGSLWVKKSGQLLDVMKKWHEGMGGQSSK